MANKLKISKEEKKVLTYWLIALVVIILIIATINFFFPIKSIFDDNNNGRKTNTSYALLNDFSRFETVRVAIEKYYSFVNMKDYDSVIKILDEDYVKENNINESNLKDYIYIPNGSASFQPDKMYARTYNGKMTYYVNGRLINSATSEFYRNEYLIVVLDGNTFHFSIKPTTESEYKEVANGK